MPTRMCWRSSVFAAMMTAAIIAVPAAASAQTRQPTQQQNDSNALALSIISAWQGSSRGATPQDRIALINKALALAVPANPWPFRDPPRDALLGQMWGQLGNEYRRVEGGERPQALERALEAYQAALRHVPRERPNDWARIQFGMGSVYVDRLAGDRADNIERAIAAFNATAEVMTREGAPSMWGSVQTSLAKAYWHRIKGTRADNLELAIAAAEGALGVFAREKEPGDWAGAQQALGAAYWGRIKGSRADNIEKALGAYEQSLLVLTEARHPKAWAGSHDNIGMAYAERARGNRAENIQKAAAAFEQASRVFTRDQHPSEWAQLKMNFANLLLDPEAGSPEDRLERAIANYDAALSVYTRERYPERFARVMLNLAIAYNHRVRGQRAENLEKAIIACQHALTFYTRSSEPLKWSTVHANLASALRQRVAGDRGRNLELAAASVKEALSVQTLAAFPQLHMRSVQQAGVIEAARRNWPTAMRYYEQAIDASNVLIGQGLDTTTTRFVVQEGGYLYSRAAYAAAMLGDAARAADLLDMGKARLLKISLGLDTLSLTATERGELDRLRRDVAELENGLETLQGEGRVAAVAKLETARGKTLTIVRTALGRGGADPASASASTNAGQLLGRFDAIAMPVISDDGALLLLASRTRPGFRALPIPGVTTATILSVLKSADPARPGWLDAYAIHSLPESQQAARFKEWEAAVAALPTTLRSVVASTLARGLSEDGIGEGASVLWVPHSGLGLLPLGLANADAAGGSVIDRYILTVAPSIAAAEVARLRLSRSIGVASLAAVVNPTGDLHFSEPEGAVAASYFALGSAEVLGTKTATPASVAERLPRATHWHFATHGRFLPRQPRQSTLSLAAGATLTLGALVDRTDLGAPRLVVLSACETGLIELGEAPEEFTGMPSAFLQAGAAGVVASLWPVDDVSTALLMTRFYDRHLGAGLAPAAALRDAQLWLRRATARELLQFITLMHDAKRLSPEHRTLLAGPVERSVPDSTPYSHPIHWAAFQYYGG